jgi:hypothetical protein
MLKPPSGCWYFANLCLRRSEGTLLREILLQQHPGLQARQALLQPACRLPSTTGKARPGTGFARKSLNTRVVGSSALPGICMFSVTVAGRKCFVPSGNRPQQTLSSIYHGILRSFHSTVTHNGRAQGPKLPVNGSKGRTLGVSPAFPRRKAPASFMV